MLRIPKSLHAQLAAAARQNGCSLNKYATQLLAQNLERQQWIEDVRGLIGEVRTAIPVSERGFAEPIASGSS